MDEKVPAIRPDPEAFLDVDAMLRVYEKEKWHLEDEVKLLITMVRDAGNTQSIRLRALKTLQDLRRELLKLAGVISTVEAKQVTDAEGRTLLTKTVVAELARSGGINHALDYPRAIDDGPKQVASNDKGDKGEDKGQGSQEDRSGGGGTEQPDKKYAPSAIPGLGVS